MTQNLFGDSYMTTIVLTGGGTAGHVTPHLALLPTLRSKGYSIHYVGTAKGIEKALAEKEHLPFHAINAGKLRRYMDMRNITDIVRIMHGFFQSFFILLFLRPKIVFSKGGFVSCPVVWASWLLRVPVVIHESDMTPGLANRLSLPFAKKICYSFSETLAHLKKEKAVYTGLPVRRELLGGDRSTGRNLCGFTDGKPVLLVMGGSLGAQVINAKLREALPLILPQFNVIHICGRGNLSDAADGYKQFEYITEELPHVFAAADLFAGRSGATTLFELFALKVPALFIPLTTGASRGDQLLNAESFQKQGFCSILRQEEMTPESLSAAITKTFAERNAMVDAMKDTRIPDGVDAVCGVIEEVVTG